jgi:hypothetical protein
MATTINYLDSMNSSAKTVNETLLKVREALAAKDMDGYGEHLAKLERQVKAHNGDILNVEFDRLSKETNPMIAAVKQFYVELKRVVEDKDKETGRVMGISIDTKKTRIDLAKFCDFAHLDKAWINQTARLLVLLVSKKRDLLAMPAADLAKQSLIFNEVVSELKDGETPNSNTQIVRLIQEIVDGTIFVDDGSGKNSYRCTNHDIFFISEAVMKFNAKEKCTLDSMNDRQFQSVMMSVFAHILGEAYAIKEAKSRKKSDEPSVPESAPDAPAEPAPDASADVAEVAAPDAPAEPAKPAPKRGKGGRKKSDEPKADAEA